MDDSRFDSLARSLGTASSRRGALGGLLAGALGLVGWPGGEDAAAHELKKKCKKIEDKKKRKACLKKAKKHAAQHAAEDASGGDGGGGGGNDQPPGCDGKADDSACNGDGRCLNGVCKSKPTCVGTNEPCSSTGSECCGVCEKDRCEPAVNGSRCHADGDCRSGNCVGYQCAQGTLTLGADCTGCRFGGSLPDCFGVDEKCASNECGCTSSGGTSCTCRSATCKGVGATCIHDPFAPGSGTLACCEGGCVETQGQFRCGPA